MKTVNPLRPWTFRVEQIPQGTTAEQLKGYFNPEDQPRIKVRSIVPAVRNHDSAGERTATITFQAVSNRVRCPRLLDDNLSIDSNFYGFTPLYHPEEPIVADIIAVTGLAAHAYGSWAHSDQKMWLRDYLPREVPNARVLIYGYPSQLQGNMSRSILSDYSNNFTNRLLNMRASAKCKDRPIIFIGHSLGCLIIKKVLNDINSSAEIYGPCPPVLLIIFLGAPHKGLQTTALETLVKSRPTEDMIRELKAESPTLTELNDKFRHVAKDVDVLTCYELCKTKTAIETDDGSWKREGELEMMVQPDSAKLFWPRETSIPCHVDHRQIAKLERGESGIYPSVSWAIKSAIDLAAAGSIRAATGAVTAIDRSRSAEMRDRERRRRERDLEVEEDRSEPQRKQRERVEEQTIFKLSRNKISDDFASESSITSHYNGSESDPSRSSGHVDNTTLDKRETFSTNIVSDSPDPEELCVATREGNVLKAQTLLARGCSVHSVNVDEPFMQPEAYPKEEKDPYLLAAFLRHEKILELLLQHGAISFRRGPRGITALHAVICGQNKIGDPPTESVVTLLLQHSPPLEQADDEGRTPLMWSARCGYVTVTKILLEHGANVHASDRYSYTALHHAVLGKSSSVVALLIRMHVNVDARTLRGETALHLARSGNSSTHVIMATMLVEAGRKCT